MAGQSDLLLHEVLRYTTRSIQSTAIKENLIKVAGDLQTHFDQIPL